jgi:hypothetical protein
MRIVTSRSTMVSATARHDDMEDQSRIHTSSPLILRDDWPLWLKEAGIHQISVAKCCQSQSSESFINVRDRLEAAHSKLWAVCDNRWLGAELRLNRRILTSVPRL